MTDDGVPDIRSRTTAYALRIVKMYGALPRSQLARTLGNQVLRSGTSVGANYREAFCARSKAEFVSKIGDCLRELEETAYWLELLSESDVIRADRLLPLRSETDQLIAIFTATAKSAKASLHRSSIINHPSPP